MQFDVHSIVFMLYIVALTLNKNELYLNTMRIKATASL